VFRSGEGLSEDGLYAESLRYLWKRSLTGIKSLNDDEIDLTKLLEVRSGYINKQHTIIICVGGLVYFDYLLGSLANPDDNSDRSNISWSSFHDLFNPNRLKSHVKPL